MLRSEQADRTATGSQASTSNTSGNSSSSKPQVTKTGFDPLGKHARGRKAPKPAAASTPGAAHSADARQQQPSATSRTEAAGPQFGAVPPDLSDLPEDVSRGLSELMRELATGAWSYCMRLVAATTDALSALACYAAM